MTDDSSPPPSVPPTGPGYTGPPPGPRATARDGLVRPLHGRYLAGVCAAIARATNTDPVLWRVLAVVLTIFGGIGLLLYLLGWLLIPEEGDTASPIEALAGRGTSNTSPVTVVVVAVLAALVFFFVVADSFRVAVLGMVAVLAALLLLLHRSNTGRQAGGGRVGAPGVPPTPTNEPTTPGAPPVAPAGSPDVPSAPPSATAPAPTATEQPMTRPQEVTTPPTVSPRAQPTLAQPTVTQSTVTQPTATHPTGYPPPPPGGYRPPFAPHGPYASLPPPPAPPRPFRQPRPPKPPRPPRQPSRLGALVLSLMCLALGTVVAVDLTTDLVRPSMYVATALTVVGLGLLVGAWLGRARWLIALGVLLTIILSVVTVAERWAVGRHASVVIWRPQSVAELQAQYQLDFGDATLDLRDVDFAAAPDPVSLQVDVNFGRLRVILPPNVDVDVTASVDFGDAHVLGRHWGGIDTRSQQVHDPGADGVGGGKLLLDVRIDAGNMEVTR